ncbi:MAG: CHASE2 domain-containing protein [Cyanobacteria bacterium P01_E01_bin.6]
MRVRRLFEELLRHKPAAIGLDISRTYVGREESFSVASDAIRLKALLQDERVYVVCKVPIPPPKSIPGSSFPPELAPEQIGFSDFIGKQDRALRRHLLWINLKNNPQDICPAEYSFNLELANKYLESRNIDSETSSDEELVQWVEGELFLAGTLIPRVIQGDGGYQDNVDTGDYQTMLNYRAPDGDPKQVVSRISLENVLIGNFPDHFFENRVVLIGRVDQQNRDFDDSWTIPYRNVEIPGILVHAQMVSHLLSGVLNQTEEDQELHRPFLKIVYGLQETSWFLACLAMGCGAFFLTRQLSRQPLKTSVVPLVVINVIGVAIVYFVSVICFVQFNMWLACIPAALAFMTSSVVGAAIYIPKHTVQAQIKS